MRRLLLFGLCFLLAAFLVSAATNYHIVTDTGTISINSTVIGGSGMEWVDIINPPAFGNASNSGGWSNTSTTTFTSLIVNITTGPAYVNGSLVCTAANGLCNQTAGGVWNSSGPLVFLANSSAFVGIGTVSPSNPLDIVVNNSGILLSRLKNTHTGSAVVVGALMRVENAFGYWGGMGMTSLATLQGGKFNNTFHIYNQGYADSLYTVDGNKSHVWFSDPSDGHNFGFDEIMRLTPDGFLGVGTVVPASRLWVNGTITAAAGEDVCISGGNCLSTAGGGVNNTMWNLSGTNLYTADLSYNVGIGTSSPLHPLHVGYASGGVTDPGLVIDATSGTQTSMQFHIAGSEKGRWRVDSSGNQVISSDGAGIIYLSPNYINDGVLVTTTGTQIGTDTSPDGQLAVDSQNSARIGLVVQGAASQSANLQEWQNSSGGVLSSMNAAGELNLPLVNDPATPTLSFGDGDTGFYEASDDRLRVSIGGSRRFEWLGDAYQGTVSGAAKIMNEAATATNPVFVHEIDSTTGIGFSGSGNLSLTTGGVERVRIADDGKVGIGRSTPEKQLTVQAGTNDGIAIVRNDVSHPVTGEAPANAYYYQRDGNGASGGNLITGLTDTDGTTPFEFHGIFGVADPTDTLPAIVFEASKWNGATGRTSIGVDETAIQFQNSATNLMTLLGSGSVGILDATPDAQLDVVVGSSSRVGQIVQGAASQSANLQEWQNSSGGVLAGVAPTDTEAAPRIFLGDSDTGFYGGAGNAFSVTANGDTIAQFRNGGTSDVGVVFTQSTGSTGNVYVKSAVSSDTVPGYTFFVDEDTGIGRAGADNLSLITGGVEAVRIDDNQLMHYNKIIGELYMMNQPGATTIPAVDTYVNVTNFTAGYSSGVDVSNDYFLIEHSGHYEGRCAISANGGNAKEYHYQFAVNNVAAGNCHIPRKMGAGGDVGAIPIGCVLQNLNVSDRVNLQVENVDDGTDVTINDVNCRLERVGGTI